MTRRGDEGFDVLHQKECFEDPQGVGVLPVQVFTGRVDALLHLAAQDGLDAVEEAVKGR